MFRQNKNISIAFKGCRMLSDLQKCDFHWHLFVTFGTIPLASIEPTIFHNEVGLSGHIWICQLTIFDQLSSILNHTYLHDMCIIHGVHSPHFEPKLPSSLYTAVGTAYSDLITDFWYLWLWHGVPMPQYICTSMYWSGLDRAFATVCKAFCLKIF
jgi:hypothetical protein